MADETYSLPESPVYHELVRRLQNTDEANAETVLNPLIQAILENIQFVRAKTGDAQADADAAQAAADNAKTAAEAAQTTADSALQTAQSKADASHTHAEYVSKANAKTMLSGLLAASDVGADAAGSAAAVQTKLTAHTGNAAIHRKSQGYRVTLTSSGWTGSGPYTQTVSVAGVTVSGSELAVIHIAGKASKTLWEDNGLCANDITVNGKMTFQADSKPTSTISVVVEVKDVGL